MTLLRTLRWSLLVTVLALIGTLVYAGVKVVMLVLILSILEISFSFDNAVVNATVLRRMSKLWQTLFLTVGIGIAVLGMRLIFPLLVVTFTAHVSPGRALDLAIRDPDRYRYLLQAAHPAIAAFGGAFLLMIFLDFMLEDRDIRWLSPIEAAIFKSGRLSRLSVVISLAVVLVAGLTLTPHPQTVLVAGLLGIVAYLLVNGLGELFDADAEAEASVTRAPGPPRGGAFAATTGKAAFFLFLYLEMLDASFSFDGVIGAFAITQNIFVIAIGLGIGAVYVRSITVYLVNRGALERYVFLEHGAHWAIGALAAILMVSIRYHVDEYVTGLVGLAFIGASVVSSNRHNRRLTATATAGPPADGS